jgi:sec-independent protein translocase protein TatB
MDLSWSELLVIGIVALIVIGPKDLPGMFRELGRFTAKLRAMGREFSRAMEQAAKESGVKDVADDLRKVTSPKAMGLDAVKSAADKFEKWDPLKASSAAKPAPKPAIGPLTPPPMGSAPAPALGPSTAALAESVAAKRAASAEVAESLRAAKSAPVPAASGPLPSETADTKPAAKPAEKPRGRVRKKPDADAGEPA